MELVRAGLGDLAELAAMNIQLRIDEQMDSVMSDAEVIDRMQEFLQGTSYQAWFLQDADLVKGYVLVDVVRKPLYVRHLFVKSEFRGQSCGRRAIELVLQHYGERTLDIEVMAWNDKAIGFYDRLGFQTRFHGMRYSLPEPDLCV